MKLQSLDISTDDEDDDDDLDDDNYVKVDELQEVCHSYVAS